MKFPVAYRTWDQSEIDAATAVLDSGQTTMGRKVEEFEEEFTAYLTGLYLDVHCGSVMVNSGSSADYVMMLAAVHLGILKPGDEVLLPAVTWPTQVWAVILAGLTPRFVDVDLLTLQIDAKKLPEAMTPKTKAIFVAHLMGNACDMDVIGDFAVAHNLLIFEDCCESLGTTFNGRKVGTFGIASSFSFFHSHHISTMEGGMVSTSIEEFADTCRMIRAHGWDAKDRSIFRGPGLNFRPTELSGAFGCVQLPKLEAMNAARNENYAALFTGTQNGFPFRRMFTDYRAKPAYFAFPMILNHGVDRQKVRENLSVLGVESRVLLGGNAVRQPAFAMHRSYSGIGPLLNADIIHEHGLYIGIAPHEMDTRSLLNLLSEAFA